MADVPKSMILMDSNSLVDSSRIFSSFRSLLGKPKPHLPMDDVVLVAVVDALEELLHQHGCVFLNKSASLDDLVVELAAFGNALTDVMEITATYSVTR